MKKQQALYTSVIIASLVIMSLCIYYLLGGFKEITVHELSGKSRTVIGVEYFGKHKSSKLDSIRAQTVADIKAKQINGQLTIVNYNYPSKDSVKFFIGASIDKQNNVIGLPSGYEFKEFTSSKIYQVIIDQNFLVRPMPNEVKEAAFSKANANGLALHPYSFELYFEDGSLQVEYWVP